MTGLVFVDSNVLLYAVDSRDARKQLLAKQWLEQLWSRRTGRTSVQVLNEFYVNATRRSEIGLSQAEAWALVSSLTAWRPHPVDAAALDLARHVQLLHRKNWWDCLIVAAANRQGCSMLLSEDFTDGEVLAGVTVRSPFSERVQESFAGHPSLVERAPLRRRGRPRRSEAPTT